MSKEEWFPRWMEQCTQPEPVITYHEELLENSRGIFERTFAVLVEKSKEGRNFITRNNLPQFSKSGAVYLSWNHDYREHKRGTITIQKAFYDGENLDGEIKSMQFIILRDEWDFGRKKPVISFVQRTLEFNLRKLANTALTVIEDRPPQERTWIIEGGSYRTGEKSTESVNIPEALEAILAEIASWKIAAG